VTDRRREDPIAVARQAGAEDRNERIYAWKRVRRSRERARMERRAYDPAPPTDEDWTVPEDETDGVRRISPPTAVADTLEALVRRRGWDERLRGATAWTRWEDIVGADMARRCEPVRLAGGTLVVRAESTVWATQLRYLTPQLQANALEVLGAGSVTAIRIVIGPLEGTAEAPAAGQEPGGSPPQD
jgi:predicted nucleic acid-binding Zn ribbon protein